MIIKNLEDARCWITNHDTEIEDLKARVLALEKLSDVMESRRRIRELESKVNQLQKEKAEFESECLALRNVINYQTDNMNKLREQLFKSVNAYMAEPTPQIWMHSGVIAGGYVGGSAQSKVTGASNCDQLNIGSYK